MNTHPKVMSLMTMVFLIWGCSASQNPDPEGTLKASFTSSPVMPAAGQAVNFTDTSTGGPTSWRWDFGDGSFSAAQNPSHAFSQAGVMTVTLVISKAGGSDSVSRTVTVAVPAASFTFRPFLPAPGQAVQFTDHSVGSPTYWQWDFGDGAVSQVQNPSHAYAAAGAYSVTLTAGGASGSASTGRTVSVSKSDILPPDRLIDWAYAGVPGGIPDNTTVFRTLTPSNTLFEVNAAIAACPSGQVVFLTAGIYSLGQITFASKAGVTLRGAGPGRTIINSTAADALTTAELSFREEDGIAVSDGFGKGSTSIILETSPSAFFRVGNLIQMTQSDDSDALGSPGEGVYHRTGFAGVWGMSATRNLRFTSRITAVNGKRITLATPIPFAYSSSLNPRAYPLRNGPGAVLCGIENMTIKGNGRTDRALGFSGADRCWVKDVEIDHVVGTLGMVHFRDSSQCEVRRCYAHDAWGFPAQADGYAFFFYYGCSYGLVVDSIAYRVGIGLVLNGSSANSVLYNLTENIQRDGHTGVDQGIIVNHGPHGVMNLVEGNITQRFQNDGYHGSTSHTTLFRNHVHGVRPGASDPRRPIDLCRGSYYHNVVGNVIGDDRWTAAYYDLAANPAVVSCVYALGFPGMDSVSMAAYTTVPWDNWTKSTGVPDPDVAGTLIRHGNFDHFHQGVVWDLEIVSHDIPESLYYSSKPHFFGSLPWPPIGPDVVGLVTSIPAKARWDAYSVSGDLSDLFRDQ